MSRVLTSRYRGVSLDRRRQSWQAYFWGRYLGRFKTELAAAAAYDWAAIAVFGGNAITNLPAPPSHSPARQDDRTETDQ